MKELKQKICLYFVFVLLKDTLAEYEILIYKLFSPSSVKIYFTIFWHPLWLLGSDFMSNYCSFVDSSLYFLVDFDISSFSLVLCGFMMIYQAVDFFLILCLKLLDFLDLKIGAFISSKMFSIFWLKNSPLWSTV